MEFRLPLKLPQNEEIILDNPGKPSVLTKIEERNIVKERWQWQIT